MLPWILYLTSARIHFLSATCILLKIPSELNYCKKCCWKYMNEKDAIWGMTDWQVTLTMKQARSVQRNLIDFTKEFFSFHVTIHNLMVKYVEWKIFFLWMLTLSARWKSKTTQKLRLATRWVLFFHWKQLHSVVRHDEVLAGLVSTIWALLKTDNLFSDFDVIGIGIPKKKCWGKKWYATKCNLLFNKNDFHKIKSYI